MSSHTPIERNRLELLQANYRQSWLRFTEAVEVLQNTMSNAGSSNESIASARFHVETVVREYRDARNLLAAHFLAHEGETCKQSADSHHDTRLVKSQAA